MKLFRGYNFKQCQKIKVANDIQIIILLTEATFVYFRYWWTETVQNSVHCQYVWTEATIVSW